MKDHISLIFNRSEIGAGTRGASLGVDALLTAALAKGNSFFHKTPSVKVQIQNEVLSNPIHHRWAKHIEAILAIYEDLSQKVETILKEDRFPLIISGDHASAGGSVAGIKKAYPNARLGVIWIDAHADLHSPYTTPSGNVHGMPIATMLNEDNLDCQAREVDPETILQWEQLKRVGGIAPKILPEDVVFIGVRDTEHQEDYLIDEYGITNYTPELLRKKGVDRVIEEIKSFRLKDCDIVYVSFDVDSLDCEVVSSGTGTPVENGLYPSEAKALLKAFMNWDKLVSLEVTEINPLLDTKNIMAETALSILEHALNDQKLVASAGY